MKQPRRAVLLGIAGPASSAGVLGATSTATAAAKSDCAQTGFPVSRGTGAVSISARGYAEPDRQGALLEDIFYRSPKFCTVADVHFIVSDGTVSRNTRDDGCGIANVTVPTVPELRINNTLSVPAGAVTLDQRALVTADKSAILVENDLQFPARGDYTIFTLANPDIGDLKNNPGQDDAAWLASRGYYDVLVASDNEYYAAFAQRESWRKQFDGQHIGIEGATSGPDKSAWRDAYLEGDGQLDSNTEQTGDLDLAFGLTAHGRDSLSWATAIGFGTDESTATDNAVASLEAGYDSERTTHVPFLS